MTDARFITKGRNPQAAVRAFENDLDLLLNKFLADLNEAMPWHFIEVFGLESARRIGNVVAVRNAVIEFDLQNRIDDVYRDFAWELTRLLRALKEQVR
jgi:hypothetical protein